MPEARTDPYIWVTWLTKLLAGENSCEWATRSRQGDDLVPSSLSSPATGYGASSFRIAPERRND